MPDLVTIQGPEAIINSLGDVPALQLLPEGVERLEDGQVLVTALADASAQDTAETRGLTVELVKTEAELEAEAQELHAAISNTPYDFSGVA